MSIYDSLDKINDFLKEYEAMMGEEIVDPPPK